MATDDQSLATLTENAIVTKLRGLDDFADRDVEAFKGSTHQDGAMLIAELTAHSSPYVAVLFEGDTAEPLEEGQQDYAPTYGIYIVVQNQRDTGAARRGDGTTVGTNKLRDVLREALHTKDTVDWPAVTAGGYYANYAVFQGCQVVFQRKDVFIVKATVVVNESPTA